MSNTSKGSKSSYIGRKQMWSNDRVDRAFAEIERNFDAIASSHKEELEEAFIKPIHDRYPFAQNGITALIASMGSGKSYNYLKMISKSENLYDQPFYELVAICSTSAKFDRTVETYKPMIRKSKLVCIEDSMLLEWLNKYMRRILKYNSINEYIANDVVNDEMNRCFMKHSLMGNEGINLPKSYRITEDHQNKPTISYTLADDSGLLLSSNDKVEVIHTPYVKSKGNPNNYIIDSTIHGELRIDSSTYRTQYSDVKRISDNLHKKRLKYCSEKLAKYRWSSIPHRCLLILDDFASHPLLKSKESEMSRLLKKLRHFNINVIICVQTTKSILKDIKRTLSDIVLFPGVSYEDFMDLMKESPAGMFDRKKLYEEYTKLTNPHDMFVIHIKAGRIIIHEARMKENIAVAEGSNAIHIEYAPHQK